MKFLNNLFLLSFICFSCSNLSEIKNKLAGKKTFAECYMRYEQEGGVLLCEAKFKEGETEKTATPKLMPDLFFNAGAMEKRSNALKGTYYKADQNGAYQTTYAFRLKKDDGETTDIQVGMSPIENFSIKNNAKINKKTGFSLQWKGEALGKSERITGLLTDKQGGTTSFIIVGALEVNEKEIPGNLFTSLAAGAGTLKLIKQRTEEKEENGVVMKNTYEYYTKEEVVEIED
jgi:hypothetical protein